MHSFAERGWMCSCLVCSPQFGNGNALLLIGRFLLTFTMNTFSFRRWLDLASLSLLIWSLGMTVNRIRNAVVATYDKDGDGSISVEEAADALKEAKRDVLDAMET